MNDETKEPEDEDPRSLKGEPVIEPWDDDEDLDANGQPVAEDDQ